MSNVSRLAHVIAAFVCFAIPLLFLPAARSEETAERWQHASGTTGTILHLAAGGSHAPLLYAVVAGEGIRRSSDNGQTWQQANTGLPKNKLDTISIRWLATDRANPLLAIAGVDWPSHVAGAIYMTTDGGDLWREIAASPPGERIHALTISNDIIYAASESHLFVSIDNGATWAQQGGWNTKVVPRAVVVDPHDAASIFLLTADSVLASNDGGRTWTNISPPEVQPTALTITKQSGILYLGGTIGLLMSTDSGSTWLAVASFPIDTPIHTILVDPDDEQVIFIATRNGVYKTANHGQTWQKLDKGLQPTQIHTLAIGQRGDLVAGTNAGIWRIHVNLPPLPTPTPTLTITPTSTPLPSPTPIPTPTPTWTLTVTPMPTATATATPAPTNTATMTPTATMTAPPIATLTATATFTPILQPTAPPVTIAPPPPSPAVPTPTAIPVPPTPTPVPPTPTRTPRR